MPVRFQRKRIKGWRIVPGAVYVGRGSRWGNQFYIDVHGRHQAIKLYRCHLIDTNQIERVKAELRGKNLVCWCPLVDQDGNYVPCHADILLEIANAD